MRLRIRETGAVVYDDEFRRLYPFTSFPAVLSVDMLNDIGVDPVLEGPQPTLTADQYAICDGVEEINGQWFTKYVAVDYTAEEIAARVEHWRQTASCTPFQGRMALADAGLLSTVQALIDNPATDEKVKIAWEYATEWRRMSPMIATLAAALNIPETQIDDLFRAAPQIEA